MRHRFERAIWFVAESASGGAQFERVQFGVDEHSNLFCALERVIDAREVQRKTGEADDACPACP
jgi:hypothetical protein